jgi:hypothetical protein
MPRARAPAPGGTGARGAPQQAGAPLKHNVNELAVFRALLAKNWALKWRGCTACCSGVEIVMPLLFLFVLCVPRLLIADTAHMTRFYAPTKISDLTWSKRLPADGAYRVYYAPNTSSEFVSVAEMAAKELLCSPGGKSVMRQVALGGRFFLDAAGIGAAGMVSTCTANPGACVSFLRAREGGLPESSALMRGDLRSLCAPACLAARDCFGPVLAEFLSGFPSEAAAVAAAAAVAPHDAQHGGGVAALLVLPPDLSTSDNVTYTLRASAADVANARALGSRWARQPFDPWASAPDVGWKSHWFLANVQRAVDVAIISFKTQPVQGAAMSGLDVASWRRADGHGYWAMGSGGGDANGGPAAQLHVADVYIGTSVKQYPALDYRTNLGCSFAALFFGITYVFLFLSTTARELRVCACML